MENRSYKSIKFSIIGSIFFQLFGLHAFGSVDTPGIKISHPQVAATPIESANSLPQSKFPTIIDYQIDEIAPTDSRALIKHNQDIMQDYRISVLIEDPQGFLLQRPTDKTPLILYANGFPLKGMKTEYFTELTKNDIVDPSRKWPKAMWVPFIFLRDSTTKEAWNSLFHIAKWYNQKITVNLTLGWSGMFSLESTKNQDKGKVTIIFFNAWVFWVIFILYLVLLITFVILSFNTGIIRDPDIVIDQNTTECGPFSLSQTQLAFWTVIAIGGFVYLMILTGLTDSLNSSILLLLGISGGTTGTASFIDYYKRKSNDPNNPTLVIKKHRSFLLDILSDGVNVSMQRTQTVLWNLVLGVYFVWYVITNKSMPEFSSTLLVLTGVSSALYVTSKGAENIPVMQTNNPK